MTSSLRIAQFAESYPPVINGAAVAVDLLCEELSRRHFVEAFAPAYAGYIDRRRVQRFPAYRLPRFPDYPLAVPFSPRIHHAFRKQGFGVVHTHSPFALGQVGRRWAREQRIPVVTTYHTLYVEYAHYVSLAPSGMVSAFLRSLSRRYCNACDRVVVPTEPVKEVLLAYGVTRPIHVIATGLQLRPPQPPDPIFPRGQLGIPPDAPLVLYAGRLAAEKNLELLFAAFARVAQASPWARLLLCGAGPAEADARRLAEDTGFAARIHFAGAIAPEQMPLVYAAADVFAFSSLTDTQGLVVTEAKAAGLPAVCVNSFGPATVVRDGEDGFLVPDDPDAFAAALLRLLDAPELRGRMRSAALENARCFSIEATAEAYEAVYRQALDGVR